MADERSVLVSMTDDLERVRMAMSAFVDMVRHCEAPLDGQALYWLFSPAIEEPFTAAMEKFDAWGRQRAGEAINHG